VDVRGISEISDRLMFLVVVVAVEALVLHPYLPLEDLLADQLEELEDSVGLTYDKIMNEQIIYQFLIFQTFISEN
jgi:hypothetical protein